MRTSFMLLFLCAALAACSCAAGDSPSTPSSVVPVASPNGECRALTETACDGLDVKRCVSDGGTLHWGAASTCAEGQICRDGSCAAIGDEASARLGAIHALLEESRDNGATARPVDYGAVEQMLRRELLLGDGSPKAYTRTLWSGLLALPQGHQSLSPKSEADEAYESVGLSLGSLSRYDACLRPYKDHAVVTYAYRKSTLLKAGDEIVAIDGKRGTELRALLLAQPLGADYLPPSDAGRLAFELRSFFSVERAGTLLTVRRAGSESEVRLPAARAISAGFGCDDAFGRDYTQPAVATVLGDGTGVLYISGFSQTSLDAFEAQVGPEFDKVKNAPRLVIDIRGNGGGLLRSALDLVSQLPDAKQTSYCEFFERTSGSSPASYVSRGTRAVDPATVPQPARFPYRGKVAVLIDGATHSAAEHFALATKLATSAIVIGTKSAGAFGTSTSDKSLALPGSPALRVWLNRSQVRAMDGKPLDGTSVTPHIEVEYEPEALAKGQDPMLDRAVAELSK